MVVSRAKGLRQRKWGRECCKHSDPARTPEIARILMSIFTRTHPPVKPTHKTPRPARPFGEGILRRPARFVPSDADLAWAAYELNKDATDFEVIGPSDAD